MFNPIFTSNPINTSSNPQVSAIIPRPAINGMERMCQRYGKNQNSHPPVVVRKPLYNQFIYYHIGSRGVFGINHFKLRNFAVVSIECSLATVDRGGIMGRIQRWSVMIYGCLQAEFMETKYNIVLCHLDFLTTCTDDMTSLGKSKDECFVDFTTIVTLI